MMHCISFGGGVQSSALALMFARGELEPMPEVSIFADTQAEPQSVYRWLDWIEGQLPFPIARVTAGDLSVASTTVRTSKTGTQYIRPAIPAYITRDGVKGMAQRHCTMDYKIAVIQREIRRRRAGREVTQYLGISWDEAHRMKPSPLAYVHNAYPLVERRLTRGHCLEWMERNGYPRPPRSACTFCPFHSDEEWRRLRDEEPDEFANAVEYERRLQAAYRDTPALGGVPFLHNSRVPLDQVDFSDGGQVDLFGNECAGVCCV